MKQKSDKNQKNLIRRYLVWCFKTTKEELDRIDRKFTQISVDEFLLAYLNKNCKGVPAAIQSEFKDKITSFKEYKEKKNEEALAQKFIDVKKGIPNAQYQYLEIRQTAIEEAILHFLGKKDLEQIRNGYELEMTNRILQSREH